MTLSPLETLFDTDLGVTCPMPAELAMLYGKLQFPPHAGRTFVISNFVETLDGVVSLNVPGHSGGAEISGHSQQDRMLMGILRAVSDAVIVGAGTLRSVPKHIWTAEYIFPDLADAYRDFRSMLSKTGAPLNVIVTASGDLDPNLPVFTSGQVPVLVVTGQQGLEKLERLEKMRTGTFASTVHVEAVTAQEHVTARQVLDAVNRALGGHMDTILVEGGPQLLGDFVQEGLLDELFLTLAPQIAGQDQDHPRLALVEGKVFAPEHSIWSRLQSVKRGDDHLFLRYAFGINKGIKLGGS